MRDSLLKKKAGLEVSEKVRKARDNRKMMKQLQTQATLQRQKEKKDLMDEVTVTIHSRHFWLIYFPVMDCLHHFLCAGQEVP